MKLEFLGTAGYHPSATRHTSVVFVPDASPEDAFVFDAGSGLFRLIWRTLPKRVNIFLSHAHLDHVCGLTYLYNICLGRNFELQLYGTKATLATVTESLFDSPLFPLRFNYATQEIVPGESFMVGSAKFSTFHLTHPGGSLAYRVDWPDKSFAYVTDTAGDGRYASFIRDVDLLVHERNFSDEYEKIAVASGHCTSGDIVRVVKASGAKRVALTHFNPLTLTDPLDEDDLPLQLPGVVAAHDEMVLDF